MLIYLAVRVTSVLLKHPGQYWFSTVDSETPAFVSKEQATDFIQAKPNDTESWIVQGVQLYGDGEFKPKQ